jgi:hypothetical protein
MAPSLKPRLRFQKGTQMTFEFGDDLLDSFNKLIPTDQEKMRKEMYEQMTGKPYRPASDEQPQQPTPPAEQREARTTICDTTEDVNFLKDVGIAVDPTEAYTAVWLDERLNSQVHIHFDRIVENTPEDQEFLRDCGIGL